MSILEKLFGKKPAPKPQIEAPPALPVRCPYCLTTFEHDGDRRKHEKCPDPACGHPIPSEYLEYYHVAPPLFLPMMGWRRSGKTQYLHGLTDMLSGAARLWKEFTYYPLNEETFGFLQRVDQARADGVLPERTELGEKEVFLLLMPKIPRWGGRTLVLRDVAGEHFDRFTLPKEQTGHLLHSRTSLLMIDLARGVREAGARAADPVGLRIEQHLQRYVMGLKRVGVRFSPSEPRNIVVVVTKASQVPSLPPHLLHSLDDDPFRERRWHAPHPVPGKGEDELESYLERLERMSAELAHWFGSLPGGNDIRNIARDHHIQLRFCLTSAIPGGVEPVADGRDLALGNRDPLHILDPLLLALELEVPGGRAGRTVPTQPQPEFAVA